MSALLDFYQQQVQENLSTIPWVAAIQNKRLAELWRQSFPTKQNEEWKYTAVNNLLAERFTRMPKSTEESPCFPLDFPLAQQITINNGEIYGIETLRVQLPSGVIVQSLHQALVEHEDLIRPYLDTILPHEHGFQALNTAMLQCGLFVYLPPGVSLADPIIIGHGQNRQQQAIYNRHLIIAESGSFAIIIEDYYGPEQCSYCTNTVTEIFIGAGASIQHCKVQRESKNAYHIGHLAVAQGQGSQFDSHSISFGGRLVRSDINVSLEQAQAQCRLNGLYVPTGKQHIDHHTTIAHLVSACQSEQDYKGILGNSAKAVFNGKIVVAKNAAHTQARQQNKNLLLSSQAQVNTKPELSIFADDVICTHGATVGQIDQDALLYLTTRGIERIDAENFLVQAFIINNLRLIPLSALSVWITSLLKQQLKVTYV